MLLRNHFDSQSFKEKRICVPEISTYTRKVKSIDEEKKEKGPVYHGRDKYHNSRRRQGGEDEYFPEEDPRLDSSDDLAE